MLLLSGSSWHSQRETEGRGGGGSTDGRWHRRASTFPAEAPGERPRGAWEQDSEGKEELSKGPRTGALRDLPQVGEEAAWTVQVNAQGPS